MARPDPYYWMRDVDSPDLLAHLVAERRWYDSATRHLSSLARSLQSEMTGRTPATDRSISTRYHGFSYYTVMPAGRDYPQVLREIDTQSGPEAGAQLVLDVEALADDSGYLELGLTLISPDGSLLAYSVDRSGDEVYELRFRDVESGADLADVVPRSYYGGAWSSSSDQFFYTVHDDAYRPHQVWRHAIGTPPDKDVPVLSEPDERFELTLRATRSGGLVVIRSSSRDTSEVWVLDTGNPALPARSVGGRRRGVEYDAEHAALPDGSDALLLVTNDDAVEFRLASCPVPRESDQDHDAWKRVRPENPAERLERVDAFAGHLVLGVRSGGRRRLRVVPLESLDSAGLVVDPLFEAGTVALASNPEPGTDRVTVADQSYVRPTVWSDLELRTGERTERRRRSAPGHDPDRYLCELRSFPSPDGTEVPVTMVRHCDTALDGSAPALLYGYGAYEATFEPDWDPALPSLLDRGVVFAHVHVRGGGEGGRRWWLDGRLGRKQNTFTDHLAVADGLDGLVDGSRLATRGLSAGGLLQGVVLSQRPDRWCAVVAEVPFVDVVTTMFDAQVPLTVNEWDEWGDPRRREEFDWLLAYSPYDNLPPTGSRPDVLVTAALHDPRVRVTEPAKWVAALRESDAVWSPRLLFRCETGAGAHTGPSGRFAHLAYEAEIYAWLLDRLFPALESAAATDAPVSNG